MMITALQTAGAGAVRSVTSVRGPQGLFVMSKRVVTLAARDSARDLSLLGAWESVWMNSQQRCAKQRRVFGSSLLRGCEFCCSWHVDGMPWRFTC